MKIYTVVAIVLIVVGVLALVYSRFSYSKNAETANLGPIEFTITERETVNIPDWAGAGVIVVGAAMLAFPLLKRSAG